MIKITRQGDESYPDIIISDDKRSFLIKRKGAPDTYWIPDYHPLNDNEDITFIINKIDGEVYNIFKDLYYDVINGNIFPLEEEDIQNKSDDEIAKLKVEKEEKKNRNIELAEDTGLVKDNVIYWHSEDADPVETSAVLTIKKYKEKIEIIFSKNKEHEDFPNNQPTYAIRISDSWSEHESFFAIFVRAHRQLQALERKLESEITSKGQALILSKKEKI